MNSADDEQALGEATSSDVGVRWRLAGRENLPLKVYEILAEDADEMVVASIANNYTAPPFVLEKLAQRPGLHEMAATNPNASVELKDQAPIGSFSRNSIDRYLEDRQATLNQRREVVQVYEGGEHPGGPLLGDVWSSVQSKQDRLDHPGGSGS
jgi:hypothetical protein